MLKEVIVDKVKKQSYFLSFFQGWEFKFYERNSGFTNDIDGGISFWPEGVSDDNTLYAFTDVSNYKQYMKAKLNQTQSNRHENGKSQLSKRREELVSILDNSSEFDNPIITLVKLK